MTSKFVQIKNNKNYEKIMRSPYFNGTIFKSKQSSSYIN